MRKHADKGAVKGPKKYWPAFRRDAQGNERIFQKPEDVPEGWFATQAEAVVYAASKVPAAVEPPPKAAPAANKAPMKRGKNAPPANERDAAIAKLLGAGYDLAELTAATDAELKAELAKVETNGRTDH